MRALAIVLLALPAFMPTAVADCDPPCGYINPLIDMDFPEKMRCGGGTTIGSIERTDCEMLMDVGESITYEGTCRWYWEMSEDGTYPNDPQQDIQISFSGTASNPGYLSVAVQPEGFVLGTADLFSPDNLCPEGEPGSQKIWFCFEAPISVTFTRVGGPTDHEMDRLEDRDGIQSFFLKAKSTASGDRFKEAFGVEEFRFDANSELAPTQDAPMPVAVMVLAVLIALIRRR